MKIRNYLILFSYLFVSITNFSVAQPILTIPSPNENEYPPQVDITHDGSKIITGVYDFILWDFQTGDMLQKFFPQHEYKNRRITTIKFSPDAKHVFVGYEHYMGDLYDLHTGNKKFRITSLTKTENKELIGYLGMVSAHFTPDCERIITCDSEGSIQVWDVKKGTELKRIDRGGFVKDMVLSPKGNIILITEISHIYFYNLENDEISRRYHYFLHTTISRNWKYLFIGEMYKYISYNKIELINSNSFPKNNLPNNGQNKLAITNDGKFVIVGGFQKDKMNINRRIYNVSTGEIVREYPFKNEQEMTSPYGNDYEVGLFQDNTRFYTVNGTNVNIWDISDLTSIITQSEFE